MRIDSNTNPSMIDLDLIEKIILEVCIYTVDRVPIHCTGCLYILDRVPIHCTGCLPGESVPLIPLIVCQSIVLDVCIYLIVCQSIVLDVCIYLIVCQSIVLDVCIHLIVCHCTGCLYTALINIGVLTMTFAL